MPDTPTTRLNKRLVQLGFVSSRRAADELIKSGKVRVGGKAISELATQVSSNDIISVSGRGAKFQSQDVTIALNKPAGYICSHAKQGNSPTIFDLLPRSFFHLKIAGRLDKDSTGLVVLSSDGNLVQTLSHPTTHKTKEYIVSLDAELKPADQQKVLEGVKLTDGISRFDSISKITTTRFRISLHEGRNRQVRRTFSGLGYTVTALERVQLGSYHIGTLASGKYVPIRPGEVL